MCAFSAAAHDEDGDEITEPIAFGLPESRVSIYERGDKRVIESNDIPNHPTGHFPNAGNPNAIAPQSYHFEVPLHPVETSTLASKKHMFGVAVNGVKFDPSTAEFWRNDRSSIWNMEAIVRGRGLLGMDSSNAHVQPNGAYHYHGVPHGLIRQLHGENKMLLIGWAADGFPMYGPLAYRDANDAMSAIVTMRPSYRLKSGTRPGGNAGPGGRYDGTYTVDFEYVAGAGDLDECNGRHGVTPEFPKGTYYYVVTADFPFVPRKCRGTPDPSFGPPDDGPRRFGPPGEFPPPPPPPPFL